MERSLPTVLSGKAENLPVMAFQDQQAWTDWLHTNHATSGLWIRLAKKASARRSVSYAEAVELALCYGWIDGQSKSYDETSWLQKSNRQKTRNSRQTHRAIHPYAREP